MNTANTILAQLGGNRFIAMTGAKNLMSSGNTLSFHLPRGATNGANLVSVTLDPSDTYTVKFSKYRALKVTTLAEVAGVYFDQLRAVFTAETGLRTSL